MPQNDTMATMTNDDNILPADKTMHHWHVTCQCGGANNIYASEVDVRADLADDLVVCDSCHEIIDYDVASGDVALDDESPEPSAEQEGWMATFQAVLYASVLGNPIEGIRANIAEVGAESSVDDVATMQALEDRERSVTIAQGLVRGHTRTRFDIIDDGDLW